MTISERSTTSWAEPAFCAPAAIRFVIAAGFLSKTVSGNAFSTLPAIGLPMLPTPMKPTDVAMCGLLGRDDTRTPMRRACVPGTLTRSPRQWRIGRRVAQQRARDDGVGPARGVASAAYRAGLAPRRARAVPRAVEPRRRPRRGDATVQSVVSAGAVGRDRRAARPRAQRSAVG